MTGRAALRAVIVGIGEAVDRPATLEAGLDPIGLMALAAHRAIADAGAPLLDRIDSIDIMHQISWRYDGTAAAVRARLAIDPSRAVYHPTGGERPVRAIHEAALRIAGGESVVALVCGGEARSTAHKAHRAGIALPWPARAPAMENPIEIARKLHPVAIAHGLALPTFVYPLYENRCVAEWRQTPAESHRESAELWARYAAVASRNPYAWTPRAIDAGTIATPSADNRMIAYPYPKLMVANPMVNQGAAILLMEESAALAAGIPAQRMVHLVAGAAADEPSDYLQRDSFAHSPAQNAVLAAIGEHLDGVAEETALELYSCFPCVPKMARRAMGLGDDITPTVTGGLTFFGGPMNNYMAHAACAMVRTLRSDGGRGLLYGQGDFVTKHHALVLSMTPPAAPLACDYRVDAEADRLRGPVPAFDAYARGPAAIETFTVLFDRQGAPDRGVVIATTDGGARTMARVPASDGRSLARLLDPAVSPVGAAGALSKAADGLLEWTAA